MSNMTSVEVIELLYQLQEIELGEDAASPKNQKASAELRAKLPPNILGHYDRLMKRGKKGVSIVSGTNCPECHMTLPTGTRAQLMRGEDIVLCDTCARYSPPDRDRRGDSPAWSGRGSRPSRRTSG